MQTFIPKGSIEKLAWLLFFPLIFAGCYPDDAELDEEMELVTTEHDVNYPFASVQTYILPDTIMLISDPDDPSNDRPVNTNKNKQILSELADHFEHLGYQRMVNTVNGLPDVYVAVSATAANYIRSDWKHWWDFWAYYPWWPGWADGYLLWYTWGIPVYYTYPVGTLVIQMMDVTGTDETRIPIVWSATINGLLTGSDQDLDRRISRDMDQAFRQSVYLSD